MLKPANCALLLILLCIVSCQQTKKTENKEVSFWSHALLDSSYSLLYKDKDTTRALHYFDSAIQQSSDVTIFPRASRFALLANYHYFFTSDDHATAGMIDSALALYHSNDLQNAYPRTYV